MAVSRRKVLAAAVLSVAALLSTSRYLLAQSRVRPDDADDDDNDAEDHVKAFEALKSGKIVPIATILDWMDKNYRGSVVEIELEFVGDYPPIYEVEYLTDEGNFLEFAFEATTGALISIKGSGAESARKKP